MSALERRTATYTFDEEANAYYVFLSGGSPDGGVKKTREVFATVDEDADGNVIGIEVLD